MIESKQYITCICVKTYSCIELIISVWWRKYYSLKCQLSKNSQIGRMIVNHQFMINKHPHGDSHTQLKQNYYIFSRLLPWLLHQMILSRCIWSIHYLKTMWAKVMLLEYIITKLYVFVIAKQLHVDQYPLLLQSHSQITSWYWRIS